MYDTHVLNYKINPITLVIHSSTFTVLLVSSLQSMNKSVALGYDLNLCFNPQKILNLFLESRLRGYYYLLETDLSTSLIMFL